MSQEYNLSLLNVNHIQNDDFDGLNIFMQSNIVYNNINTCQLSTIEPRQCELQHLIFPKRKGSIQNPSFGDNFMHQHISAYLAMVQNTMEYAQDSLASQQSNDLKTLRSLYFNEAQQVQFVALLKLKELEKWTIEVNVFEKLIEETEDIKEFLMYIVKVSSRQLALEVIPVILDVCQRYAKFNFKQISSKEILQMATNFTSHNMQRYTEKIQFKLLNPQKSLLQNPRKQSCTSPILETFLDFLTKTTFLILSGYFLNPYFGFKKDLSGKGCIEHHKRCLLQLYSDDSGQEDLDSSLSECSLMSKRFKLQQ